MKQTCLRIIKSIVIVLGLNLLVCTLAVAQTTPHRCITWEKLSDSGPDLQQIGKLSVRHSKDIESSSWSIGCETLDRDQADFNVYKKYVGELGAKHARLQSGWAKCEKQKGVYDFKWLDDCVYGVKEQGAQPWICLCYGNPIYGSGKHLATTVGKLANSEEGMAAWLKYVEATVTRYKDVVNTWGIWNEPYYQDMGDGFTPQLKGYTSLLIATAEVVRKAQPDAIILGEIDWQSRNQSTVVMLEKLKDAGKLDLVDYWSYHPYKNNPDACYAEIEKLQKLLQSYNPDYKLHQGEAGCPSILEWTHALKRYPWTEYSQAKWHLRRMAGDHVRNIPSSVFTIIDLKYPDMLQSFGLIRSNLLLEFIYKRPSYYAVQHMFAFFDDTVKPVGELEYKSPSLRKMTVAGFEKDKKPVVLIWYNDQVPSDDLEWDLVNLIISNVTFEDPVYVEMITGKVYEIEKTTWSSQGTSTEFFRLPVWDSPIMIAERSQVSLQKEQP